VEELRSYERSYLVKFIGVGLPRELEDRSPNLPSRLWLELDIVLILIMVDVVGHEHKTKAKSSGHWHVKSVDEQADSMVRKCIMYASFQTAMDSYFFVL
jgi:alpha,alpha-trehalose phosphorylase (configuration-retaining)